MGKRPKTTIGGEKITRKDAIKKAGVTALAASSLLLLDTKAKACTSVANNNSTLSFNDDHNGHDRHRSHHR